MMLDWNQYRTQLTAGVKELTQLNPDTVKGYMQLSGPRGPIQSGRFACNAPSQFRN
jgi:hypothetical protein